LQDSSAAEVASWWRMVELCLPTHEACGAVTFRPEGGETFDDDWETWSGAVFHPVLRPAVFSQQDAAARADLPSLLRADRQLGNVLSSAAAAASLAAGRKVLLDYLPPQGARLVEHLQKAARQDDATGHLATVFALRAHTFHLPAVQTAAALLLAECVLGAQSAGLTLSAARTVAFLQAASGSAPAPAPFQVLGA
jgi:hypothetical protein